MKKAKYTYVFSIAFISLFSSIAVAQSESAQDQVGAVRCISDRTVGSGSSQLFAPSSDRHCAVNIEFTSPGGNGTTERFGRCTIQGKSTPTNSSISCSVNPSEVEHPNGWTATNIGLPNLANQMHPDDVINGCAFHKGYPQVSTTEEKIPTGVTLPAGEIYTHYINSHPHIDWDYYCENYGEKYCPPRPETRTVTDYTILYRVNCP